MKTFTFLVTVPAKGTDSDVLDPQVVALYIKDAVSAWSGQFNPDEDNMFYWAQDKTVVKYVGAK